MKQNSLGLPNSSRRTRKREFLESMDRVVPWSELVSLIEPYAPESGRRGQQPFAVEAMLRIHFMQQWFNLSDPAMEEALHDVPVFRDFAGLSNWAEAMPSGSSILRFRHLLERHKLAEQILATVNDLLSAKGLLLKAGTVVDATLIAAPSSTKNEKKQRDPEMHQTKKGNQWYFGMKAHIGADRDSQLVHTVVVTAANVADVTQTAELLHGEETQVYADAGSLGVEKRAEIVALERKIDWQIARKRGAIQAMAEGAEKRAVRAAEKLKASVRAFVEHPFHIVKNLFGYRKVRYRGLAKNGHQLYTLFALANVVIGGRRAAAGA